MKKLSLALFCCGVFGVASLSSLAAPKPKKPVPVKAKPANAKPASALVVQGKVKASTKPPRPGSVPYKDAVIALHLVNARPLKGKVNREIVVFVWGMHNNKWTPAATYRPGQVVTLSLSSWEKAERKYGRYNRFELQDEATYDLPTYWGE